MELEPDLATFWNGLKAITALHWKWLAGGFAAGLLAAWLL
jgi:hypothetical protein